MGRILIIEDNEMNRDLLQRRLARRGLESIVAEDGIGGMALARSEKPDLILMDISLPDADGLDLTRELKKDPRTRSIPVIVLTAHAMEGDRERSLAAGADDYDTKPVDMVRLMEKIGRFIPFPQG